MKTAYRFKWRSIALYYVNVTYETIDNKHNVVLT